MSFLLLFQSEEFIPSEPVIAGLELGSLISVSGDFNLAADFSAVSINVEWTGDDTYFELFTNHINLDFGVQSRTRVYFSRENLFDIAAIGRTLSLINFIPEPAFDITTAPSSLVFIHFGADNATRFFDIAASSFPKVGITFAKSVEVEDAVESDEDLVLRYIEPVV